MGVRNKTILCKKFKDLNLRESQCGCGWSLLLGLVLAHVDVTGHAKAGSQGLLQ